MIFYLLAQLLEVSSCMLKSLLKLDILLYFWGIMKSIKQHVINSNTLYYNLLSHGLLFP